LRSWRHETKKTITAPCAGFAAVLRETRITAATDARVFEHFGFAPHLSLVQKLPRRCETLILVPKGFSRRVKNVTFSRFLAGVAKLLLSGGMVGFPRIAILACFSRDTDSPFWSN
jgi:hypothetical protein